MAAILWDDLLAALRRQMRDWSRPAATTAEGGGAQWHLHLQRRLGDSVQEGDVLAEVAAPLAERQRRRLALWVREAYRIERERSADGDTEYGLIMLGGLGEKAAISDADPQMAVQCLDGLFVVLGRILNLPQPAQRFLVRAEGGTILIERPTVNLFDTTIVTLSRIVDASLQKQLGIVPREMGSRAADLLLREGRQGEADNVQRLLKALLPLYSRSLLHLQTPRFSVPLLTGLQRVARTLDSEGRETEAKCIADALGTLIEVARGRPDLVALAREAGIQIS